MRRRKRSPWGLLFICLFIAGGSFYGVYQYIRITQILEKKPQSDNVQEQVNTNNNEKAILGEDELEPHVLKSNENIEASTKQASKILPSTKLVYQYYYEIDGNMVEDETEPPYYLIDMTREQVIENFPDWDLQSFSNKQVVLRKIVKEKSPYHYYRIGVHEGFVAVFFENGVDLTLREVTQTPVSSLPEEEQEKLKKGISVYGEEELIRLLEDYTT